MVPKLAYIPMASFGQKFQRVSATFMTSFGQKFMTRWVNKWRRLNNLKQSYSLSAGAPLVLVSRLISHLVSSRARLGLVSSRARLGLVSPLSSRLSSLISSLLAKEDQTSSRSKETKWWRDDHGEIRNSPKVAWRSRKFHDKNCNATSWYWRRGKEIGKGLTVSRLSARARLSARRRRLATI